MKRITFLFSLLLSYAFSFGQVYILNEDFVTTNGTTPPFEWSNYKITGTADDLWHFEMKGDTVVNDLHLIEIIQ